MKNMILCLMLMLAINKGKAMACTTGETIQVYSEKLAAADIKAGNIKFLLRGGIAPTYFKGQELFEKKYGLKYYEFGCVMPADISIKDYNKVVAAFMDGKFGKDWRKEVRKDVVM
ncbi:hypothetical protein [Pedobacter aquatilis]|uniref:FEKKY domain-containing protein n=1 Tax=Pedobacter aquatilis TaxID=351343 RepID=UPI002931A457|nr:hypothetical protein [Pedobacter aquatilis]